MRSLIGCPYIQPAFLCSPVLDYLFRNRYPSAISSEIFRIFSESYGNGRVVTIVYSERRKRQFASSHEPDVRDNYELNLAQCILRVFMMGFN